MLKLNANAEAAAIPMAAKKCLLNIMITPSKVMNMIPKSFSHCAIGKSIKDIFNRFLWTQSLIYKALSNKIGFEIFH